MNEHAFGGPGLRATWASARGRLWPLLTGERGHYELAAGRDPLPYVRAMECFANESGLLPEQVWDGGPLIGRGTGSATPLVWTHAEYVRLLRSRRDGAVFDRPQAMGRTRSRAGRQTAKKAQP
jgi:glucoamylase